MKILELYTKNHISILLFLIVILSLITHIWDLQIAPIGFNQDESTNGYDAYCLGTNLRDYHNNLLPVMLQSYNDWVSPLITYITIPFVKTFGLHIWVVRLPVAILGSLSVLIFYFIIRRLLNNKHLALLSSFLYACSPWLITFSRWAVPPSIVPFFMLLTFALLLKTLKKESSYFQFITLALSLTLLTYSYPILKLFVPLFSLSVFIIYLKDYTKGIILTSGIYSILVSPIYILTFLDPTKYNRRLEIIQLAHRGGNIYKEFCINYRDYFYPHMYFGNGDCNVIHHPPGFTAIPIYLAPFLYIGFAIFGIIIINNVFKNKIPTLSKITLITFSLPPKISYVILSWVVLFPIGASLTMDKNITTRIIFGLPLIMIYISFGLFTCYKTSILLIRNSRPIIHTATIALIVLSIISLYRFTSYYHSEYKEISKAEFNYGTKEVFEFIQNHKNEYDTLLIDNKIFKPDLLFHTQYPPTKIQNSDLGKYVFTDINSIISNKTITTIHDNNSKIWFRVVEIENRKWGIIKNFQ